MATVDEQHDVMDLTGVTGVMDSTGVTGVIDLTGVTGVMDSTGVTGVMDLTGVTGVMDSTGVTGVMDLTGNTGVTDLSIVEEEEEKDQRVLVVVNEHLCSLCEDVDVEAGLKIHSECVCPITEEHYCRSCLETYIRGQPDVCKVRCTHCRIVGNPMAQGNPMFG